MKLTLKLNQIEQNREKQAFGDHIFHEHPGSEEDVADPCPLSLLPNFSHVCHTEEFLAHVLFNYFHVF